MNLNLDSGMYKMPIENGVKKVDGGSTQGNISHKNLLEGAVKKIVLQVFQWQNCSELRILPWMF